MLKKELYNNYNIYFKNNIFIDEEFKADDIYTVNKILDGTSIFLKYWILGEPFVSNIVYNITIIPGSKEGISTSIASGFNIGVDKDIDKAKIDSAMEAVMYIGSVKYQREYLMRRQLISAVTSLYYDEEICEVADCPLFINMQPLNDPFYTLKKKDDYSEKFRNYVYEFLFGNATTMEASKKIIDITKIYSINFDTSESYAGLISTIVISVIALLMLLSLILLFRENFSPFFTFLSVDFWILSVFGSIFIMCISFTFFGQLTTVKCYLYSLFQSLGLSFILIPILYKLIIKFPDINSTSKRIKKHKYLFLFFFIILDNIWNGLLLIIPYDIEDIIVEEGKNFQVCKAVTTLCKLVVITRWIYVIFIILIILLLIFIEWNIKSHYYVLRFIVSILYIDVLGFVTIICINYIKFDDYISYYLFHSIMYIIIAVFNYMFIYGFRLFLALVEKTNVRSQIINKINKEFIESDGSEFRTTTKSYQTSYISKFVPDATIESNIITTNYNININNESKTNQSIKSAQTSNAPMSPNKTSIYSKIIDYHYYTESLNG